MKVKTEIDAWKLANRLFPGDYELDPESKNSAGYPIFRSIEPGSNASICDLYDRLELNYDDGRSENIWIEDRREKGAAVTVGMYRDRTVFGKVKVREVMELDCERAYGLVVKELDDGRQGIEITLANGEIASFGNENVAYVRFG
ncbi:MAG: hypothetical protein HFI66_11920 [Lachnospiraceae bacterium]|jgi:hypothetical protein|nr:hypothetical protein [Lachnospiraceae bacterium]